MSLAAGTRLGAYEVLGSLGAGGMGEVYRARDTKLGRDVALKILPEVFRSEPERLARFSREARTLAALNHPHIASIYGIEDTSETSALVLELVDGPTLADRLTAGPIARDEALDIAKQIAAALEAAHDQGIVHRDLKPANVKVRSDGTVKVLDFGLAKLHTPAKAGAHTDGAHTDDVGPGFSPATITSPDMTQQGMILGTAAYMAPEQARGRPVDKRADIWAFGCVLYEMLSGRRPFQGDDVTAVLARVIERDPDWTALPAATPPWLLKLLGRCLEKDPRRRLRDIGDAALEIETAPAETVALEFPEPAAASAAKSTVIIAASFALGALLAGVGTWMLTRASPESPHPLRRLTVSVSERRLDDTQVISPDGSSIAYTAGGRLWIRDLSQATSREVPNSVGADSPFWSPNGDRLAYRRQGALWAIPAQGGDAIRLCEVTSQFASAAWGHDEIVIAAMTGWSNGELFRVAPSGGAVQRFLAPDPAQGELRFGAPAFTPDGRHLLYALLRNDGNRVMMWNAGKSTEVLRTDRPIDSIAWSPTGHVLYTQADTLFATPWRLDGLSSAGEPIRVMSAVARPTVSTEGTLVVAALSPNPMSVALVDRRGTLIRELVQTDDDNARPALSADGTRVAYMRVERGNQDIWVREVTGRGAEQRLTQHPADEHSPAWLPSGDQLVYTRVTGTGDQFVARTDGDGEPRPIVSGPLGEWGGDVSRDGRYLTYYVVAAKTLRDLWYLPLKSNAEPVPFLQSPHEEALGTISPDGQLIAYQSNESGDWEVYVKRFPTGEGRWKVSNGGGRFPRWNPRGGELFYNAGNRLAAVAITTTPAVAVGDVDILFEGDRIGTMLFAPRDCCARRYDVMPDGQGFVVVLGAGRGTSEITVVENWTAAIR